MSVVPIKNKGHLVADDIIKRIQHVIGTGPANLHIPEFHEADFAAISTTLASGFVSSAGEAISEFERTVCDFTGAKYAIAVVNGTAALQLALLAAGVQPNDEVLVPALTFVATGNAILHCGAVPHFVDSDMQSLGISVEALEAYLEESCVIINGRCQNKTTGRYIAAIVPVHVFGVVGEMEQLVALAARFHLDLVEDAAEALGSFHNNRHAGLFGVAGAISFNGNKIITTGGGGIVITNDKDISDWIRHIATTAKQPHPFRYYHDQLGFNYRMPALNAALGIGQMQQLETYLIQKVDLAGRYRTAFAGSEFVDFHGEKGGVSANNWLNAVRLKTEFAPHRDEIVAQLIEAGFECRPIWDLLSDFPHFSDCPTMSLSNAKQLVSEFINIPSSPFLVKNNAN